MASQQQQTEKLDVRGPKEVAENVRTMNLGGESQAGAPVVIGSGVYVADPIEHQRLLREHPPIDHIPAQDPTPLDDEDGARVGTYGRDFAAQGGPGSARIVNERTPASLYGDAGAPYNDDVSSKQVADRKGTDTTEEDAEKKPKTTKASG